MVPNLIDINTSRYKWRRSLNGNSVAETVFGGKAMILIFQDLGRYTC